MQIEYKGNKRLVKHPAALIANLSRPIPTIPDSPDWDSVLGLAHVFNNKLFFTRDIMDDDAVPKHLNVPEPKPKPKPKLAPKPTAAPKPGPKGQHRQEFRMVYHRKKGFTFEPVEQ